MVEGLRVFQIGWGREASADISQAGSGCVWPEGVNKMSRLSLRLPDSLHRKIKELAKQEAVSINPFIATAAAEKAASLLTVSYLEERGRRGNARLFDRVLAKVRGRRWPGMRLSGRGGGR